MLQVNKLSTLEQKDSNSEDDGADGAVAEQPVVEETNLVVDDRNNSESGGPASGVERSEIMTAHEIPFQGSPASGQKNNNSDLDEVSSFRVAQM